ncbi:MAG: LuxR C-terminal-related transcriptional regulator [Actinomycetota bacterium]|nr:LuxR C-terminal-related transcriptional regulator [Actinomycetota bacterium]
MRTDAKERATDRISELAGRGLDLKAFWDGSAEVLSGVVPHFGAPCWFTLDPASLLVTSHYDHGQIPSLPPEWLAHEYYEDDVHNIASVARSDPGISTLHEAAGGDPSQTPRWQTNIQYGGDQEVLVALRTRTGEAWGLMGLYRETGKPWFDADELEFLRAVAPHLAQGARRGLLVGEASDPEGPEPPGLVVLNDDWSVDSLTPGAETWLNELPDGDWERQKRLPPAVLAVAGRALRTVEGDDAPGEVAVARVLSSEGRWLVLHGAALVTKATRRVAVIVEPADSIRITPLLMAAYGLTDREQEVTRLVLSGDSTRQIAERLFLSPHTVQEHLKNVFEKTGVRSRRELVGKVFFNHYEPRLRDNERRAAEGRPLRGGPMPAQAKS